MFAVNIDFSPDLSATVAGGAGGSSKATFTVVIAGASHAYHNINDRWPESVDVKLLSRYARAIASGVLQLSRTTA